MFHTPDYLPETGVRRACSRLPAAAEALCTHALSPFGNDVVHDLAHMSCIFKRVNVCRTAITAATATSSHRKLLNLCRASHNAVQLQHLQGWWLMHLRQRYKSCHAS